MDNLYFNIKTLNILRKYFKGYYFLDKSNIINREIDLDLHSFNKLVLELENILERESFSQLNCFNEWQDEFERIYGKQNISLHLYAIFIQIFYIAHLFILQNLIKENYGNNKKSKMPQVRFIQSLILNKFSVDISLLNRYFLPQVEILELKWIDYLKKLKDYTIIYVFEAKIKPEYLFDYLIQQGLKSLLRHSSGEYYTPPFLVKKMVNETYKFGEMVLDPSCGTGNFLIEIIKSIYSSKKLEKEKLKALNNIYGFDINPISIFLAILNVLLLVGKSANNLRSHFFIVDSLFDEINLNDKKFDLIIGNPPWYTFRDIESVNYQNKIKILAEELEIKPSPKNVLNIEISSLFFYKAKKSFMKLNAKIFFVITKGVITGSHASQFRKFKGFKSIKIWKFDKKIESIFNIDFICLYARRTNDSKSFIKYQVPSICFGLDSPIERLNYFDDVKLKPLKKEILVPYAIKENVKKPQVHKLISKTEFEQLIPIKPSIYQKRFHKGADLNPRNLIFISTQLKDKDLAIINPDERIFKRAKIPWHTRVFKNSIIEKEYIFKAMKSTELVKFLLFDFYHIFLPISKETQEYNYSNLKINAQIFYDKINEYYLNNKKSTTKNKSLMDNLNRWSKLINERQFSQIKVVYNNSGSILSAAVVQGDFLITGDLSFYATDTLEEAYYLSAILNSNLLNEQIKIKKSSRHIFKIPFENPIQEYNKNDKSHQNLAQLARQGEKIAKSLIREPSLKKSNTISRNALQKILTKKLNPILTQIDELLKPQFIFSK